MGVDFRWSVMGTVTVQVLESAGETDVTFQSQVWFWEQAQSEAHCASVLISPCMEGRD